VLRKVKKKMAEMAAEQQAQQMALAQAGGQPGSPNNGGQPQMSGTGETAPPPMPEGEMPSELMAALQGVGGMTPPQ
jgi:hypothetical protein